ncbi:MAG: hypothetical protein QXJ69_03100 [Desulfurococcaceae archaeon]
MPKNPVVTLREELRKHNIELLDVYSFREHDIIRLYDKQSRKVILHKSKRKISSLLSREEIINFISEITKSI